MSYPSIQFDDVQLELKAQQKGMLWEQMRHGHLKIQSYKMDRHLVHAKKSIIQSRHNYVISFYLNFRKTIFSLNFFPAALFFEHSYDPKSLHGIIFVWFSYKFLNLISKICHCRKLNIMGKSKLLLRDCLARQEKSD